ncbi:molybdenum metabolism regulator [Micromonospora sp. S4605]|nr:molybdenum metabolism regulator [Micromonospora sp. S4605]
MLPVVVPPRDTAPVIATDDFWALIEASAAATDGPDARLAWLTDRLAERPTDDVVDFALRLDEARARVDTWSLWGAALRVCGGLCSDDGFHYFQAWLVGLGRETFERVAADPDALADVPQVRRLAGRSNRDWAEDEWPDWEALDYVAERAYERITGDEDGLERALAAHGRDVSMSPDPQDEEWALEDRAEFARRFPRLAELFPLPDRQPWSVWETARP